MTSVLFVKRFIFILVAIGISTTLLFVGMQSLTVQAAMPESIAASLVVPLDIKAPLITPTILITSTVKDPTNGSFPVKIVFSEEVTGFVSTDIVVTNGITLSFVEQLPGLGYTIDISPTGTPVTIMIGNDVVSSTSSGVGNFAAVFSINYDPLPPIITLIGRNPVTTVVGFPYIDAGATAADNFDGDVTTNIVVSSNVVTTIVGSYFVTYSVADSAGNQAQLMRSVYVTGYITDTLPPTLTLHGANPLTIESGFPYTDPGATAIDNFDGDVTASIIVSSNVVTTIVGSYFVMYIVSDSVGNQAQATRIVNVIDTLSPIIIISGVNPITIEGGLPYDDAGATAFDIVDGDLTNAIQTESNVVTTTLGTYTVTYIVSDSVGNGAMATRTVHVDDTLPPVISLIGVPIVTIEGGDAYQDAGAMAVDLIDGDVSQSIVTSGTVNTLTVGTYPIEYNVTDSSGNMANEVTRVVFVEDTIAPTIIISGANLITTEGGMPYNDLGATATDIIDGDLTDDIATSSNVVTITLGTYSVVYTVADSTGNMATVTRTVYVTDTLPPIIELIGNATVIVERGDSYEDAGAIATDLIDGDLSDSIVTSGTVNTLTVGVYTLTYNIADSSGNMAETVMRTVIVTGSQTPTITILGDNPLTTEGGFLYKDPGATAFDNIDGDLTHAIQTESNVVTTTVGIYFVTYVVTNSINNIAVVTRAVIVTDTIPPIITLIGPTIITTTPGVNYEDPRATALDIVDGDLTQQIEVDNPVNIAAPGEYVVTYNVADVVGNDAIEVSRQVIVPEAKLFLPLIIKPAAVINIVEADIHFDAASRSAGMTAFTNPMMLDFSHIQFEQSGILLPPLTEVKVWAVDTSEPEEWKPYVETGYVISLSNSVVGEHSFNIKFRFRDVNNPNSNLGVSSIANFTFFYLPNGDFQDGLTGWTIEENAIGFSQQGNGLRLGSDQFGCDSVPANGFAKAFRTIELPSDSGYKLYIEATIYTYDQLPKQDDNRFDAFEIAINNSNVARYGNSDGPLACDIQRIVELSDSATSIYEPIPLDSYSGSTTLSLENYTRFDNFYNTYTDINKVWLDK